MSQNNNKKTFEKLKTKLNKNNLLVIGFFIFLSIAIIIGVTLGTKREWYDVISVLSIFYIALPILVLIFTMNEKGWIRKTADLFKFKEMKNMKKPQLTLEEQRKIQAFELDKKNQKSNQFQIDLSFILIVLMIYGLILLIITIPSLILFSIK